MVLHDLSHVFNTLDVDCKGFIEWDAIHEFDEALYFHALDIDQIEAAIDMVCGKRANGKCYKDYFPDLVKELERRHAMEERNKWDFCAIDVDNIGRISIQSALFLSKAVHGERFSLQNWKQFLSERDNPFDDISYDEMKLFLCNIPEYGLENSDVEYTKQEMELNKLGNDTNLRMHHKLRKLQEDDSTLAEEERQRVSNSTQLKVYASNLLNRMDEIGMDALLENDLESHGISGRPKEKVTATELLNALKEKYNVLRGKVLLEMLRNCIGSGIWQTFTETEKQEKLFQLKVKEEKIRKENNLERMVMCLPGAGLALDYNLFSIMGESSSQLEKRITEQQNKADESGLSNEEIELQFLKQLDDREQQKSSTDAVLVDIEKRYQEEKDTLTNKLQGISGYQTMNAMERENILLSLVQCRLRGMQEMNLESCGICIGLTERIRATKHCRTSKDTIHQTNLSKFRIAAHKNRRTYEAPVVPPKLFSLKDKLGRVDLTMLLVQECEHRYALERVALLTWMSSREGLVHRAHAKNLKQDEKKNHLAVLCAQWKARQTKSSSEKVASVSQVHCLLEEAVAVKLELHKEELLEHASVQDIDVNTKMLKLLQEKQDEACQSFIPVGSLEKHELESLRKEQVAAVKEGWFENIAIVVFGIADMTKEENALLQALNDKYDTLRDKLLLESLMTQYGKAEWSKMSEQERQNQLARIKLLAKKLRKEGKYDELAKLFGDAAKNIDSLNDIFGQDRQKYLDRLNERLRNRKQCIGSGKDPNDIEHGLIDEEQTESTGNILKDLEKRFDEERDALLRRLRDETDRENRECERQAEITRLRLEARKAGREANFNGAALVLGLAERNRALLDDKLKNDRKRQEKLARERLFARQNRKRSKPDEEDAKSFTEPPKDDLMGWQDLILKELERKQADEQNMFLDLLQDPSLEENKCDSRNMNRDQRNKRLNELLMKRKELNLQDQTEQEDHELILEIGLSIKFVSKQENLSKNKEDISAEDVNVSLMADLQQAQDEETRNVMDSLQQKTQEDLQGLRNILAEDRKTKKYQNIATVIFKNDANVDDEELVKALDKKYDTLLDKLALDALKKQLGDAEWANLSEQERQRSIMKLRLTQKRLLKEGKLEEAARLLGEGFKAETQLNKLMGENKKRYSQKLKERLQKRRERLARGEPVDDLDESELPEDLSEGGLTNPKSLLEGLQRRYDDERDDLLRRLHSVDAHFMNERERQAELMRLKREQRKVEQEEKFGAAALVLGLAERSQAALNERLQNDRVRQEQLAKERLQRLRDRKRSSKSEKILDLDSKNPNIRLMEMVEKRHIMEQEDLLIYIQNVSNFDEEKANVLSTENRMGRLQMLKSSTENFKVTVDEMVVLKFVNRQEKLQSKQESDVKKDDVIVSIMGDLQEKQDQESAQIMKFSVEKTPEDLTTLQKVEMGLANSHEFPNLLYILSLPEVVDRVDENVLVEALKSKYDALKDKLILEALEKQIGQVQWASFTEKQRQNEMVKLKLEQKKLLEEGKYNDAAQIMSTLLETEKNVNTLLCASQAEQERLLQERLAKRKLRKLQGLSDQEIKDIEAKEDETIDEDIRKSLSGSRLEDLQKNFEAEKEALLQSLQGADTQFDIERKRQLELSRLRREARKAQAEEKFNAAALVLGMAKLQQTALGEKLKSDRSRQEQLARERLEARKNKTPLKQHNEIDLTDSISQDGTRIALQECLLEEVERRHLSERNFLIELLNSDMGKYHSRMKTLSIVGQQARLIQLKEIRKSCRECPVNSAHEQVEILVEAVAIRTSQMKQHNDFQDIEISVRLLADLQDIQDKEVMNISKDLDKKDIVTIRQYIEFQQNARKSKWHDNVALVLIEDQTKQTVEDNLMNALKEKYDAMKEKLFEEALKTKFGEEMWNMMDKKEKLEHLSEMKANDEVNKNGNNNELSRLKVSSIVDVGKGDATGIAVMSELEAGYNTEKDIILSMLQSADTQKLIERERQLVLAKLRREKQRIKREQKYDGAALVFGLAHQNQAKKEASYETERTRQEKLARKRIMARRQQQRGSIAKSSEEKLQDVEQQDKKEDVDTIAQLLKEGIVALQDSVLNEMEKKHQNEQKILLDLIQKVSAEKYFVDDIMNMDIEESMEKLSLIDISRNRLRDELRAFMNSQKDEIMMSEEEKKQFNVSLVEQRAVLNKLLKDGLLCSFACKANVIKGKVPSENLLEECVVSFMTDLQEKQTQESNALLQALLEMNDVNITEEDIQEEESKIQNEVEEELKELETKIGREKADKLKNLNESEAVKYMDQLKERENVARMVIQEQINRQRELALQRLAHKRRKREDKEYESDLAMAMITNASKAGALLREKTMALQGVQKYSLDERLRKRREERKRKQEAAANNGLEVSKENQVQAGSTIYTLENVSLPNDGEKGPRQAPESEDVKLADVKKKKPRPPLPGGGMKREKTVVEKAAEIPENRKKEMMNLLMREQTAIALQRNKEQDRQEQMVHELRERRRKKMQAREMEAAAVLGLGQRQKTIVEDKKKTERERQIDQIRERVNRIKTERTLKSTTPESGKRKTFANLVHEQPAGLTEDEKMQNIAKEVERKLKEGAIQNASTVNPQPEEHNQNHERIEAAGKNQPRAKLDKKTREQILKERQKNKREQKKLSILPSSDN